MHIFSKESVDTTARFIACAAVCADGRGDLPRQRVKLKAGRKSCQGSDRLTRPLHTRTMFTARLSSAFDDEGHLSECINPRYMRVTDTNTKKNNGIPLSAKNASRRYETSKLSCSSCRVRG